MKLQNLGEKNKEVVKDFFRVLYRFNAANNLTLESSKLVAGKKILISLSPNKFLPLITPAKQLLVLKLIH